MADQATRRATTRATILQAARTLFAANGYDATSLAEIQRATGLSRGAIYHHFDSKEAIFEALFEREARGAMERAAERVGANDGARSRLIEACRNWLVEMEDPEVATLVLVMAPEVLGWRRSRDLEEKRSLRMLSDGLRAAIDAGEVGPLPVEMTARLLNAVLAEFALTRHLGAHATLEEGFVEASIEALLGPSP